MRGRLDMRAELAWWWCTCVRGALLTDALVATLSYITRVELLPISLIFCNFTLLQGRKFGQIASC